MFCFTASTTTVIVQDLKSKVYYFKLRACTNAGEGLSSHIVAIDTLACNQIPCPPCRPPQECSSHTTGEGNINVQGVNQVVSLWSNIFRFCLIEF